MGEGKSRVEVAFWWCCVLTAIAVTAAHNWYIRQWMLDDAFISFRYSENWAKGLGLVYNAGERVEGYTSFLWVLLLGVGKRMGGDTVLLARVSGAIFGGLTLFLLAISYRLVSSVTRTSAALAVLFLGTCGAFTPWLSSGMEVSLFTFLILATVLVHQTDLIGWSPQVRIAFAGVLCGLTMLARPEGALLAALLTVQGAWQLIRQRNRLVLVFVAALCLVYAPYFAWRLWYYGFLLPNTFYAKVGLSIAQLARGWNYAGQAAAVCAPLIALTVVSVVRRNNRNSPFLILLFAFCALQFIYVVAVGGDCMPAFRFLTPAVPLLALAAAIGATAITRRWMYLAALAVLSCGYNLYAMSTAPAIARHIRDDLVAYRGKFVGLWLKDNVPPAAVLATNTAGSIAYFSQLRIIDMLGLNDVHIAHKSKPTIGAGMAGHEGADGDYVLSRLPDLVQFHSSLGGEKPYFRGDSELYINPAFQAKYSAVAVPIEELQAYAVFYLRNDLRVPTGQK